MSQDNQPLVSIVIPVYNGSNYMREAIDSALMQTYRNIEIIVVNDGSKDDGATRKIALSYGNKIRYIEKENGGVSSALNTGIKAMNGTYFSWLSHDDKYLPDKVNSQVDALSQCKRNDIIAICGSKQINDRSEEIPSQKRRSLWDEDHVGQIVSWDDALLNLIDYGSFGGCSLLIPKEAFDRVGLFDENLRYCQDFLMWIRIFLEGYSLMRTPGTHVCSRVHRGQLTQTGRELFRHDSTEMGNMLLTPLSQRSNNKHNFLKSYAIYNAKYDMPEVSRNYITEGRRRGLLSIFDSFQIRVVMMYGKIRPEIRKIYYSVFRSIKTK